jgi:hypothetical protein
MLNDLHVADDAAEGAALCADPDEDRAIASTEPRRERPRCKCPCPDRPAAQGSFTSRLSVSIVALLPRWIAPTDTAGDCGRTVATSAGNADAPIWDRAGAKARLKASLRSVGAARP